MAELTPMMKQYNQIKDQHKDKILFYRLGDFYEMFFEDAILASKELDLTLTGRDCGQKERAPMCGVPYHSCDSYIARLVNKGYKVAICEQTEDPALAKGLVNREIVRIITPGTVIETSMLDDSKNNFISCVFSDESGIGITFADISTGDIYTTTLQDKSVSALLNELGKFSPKEAIFAEDIFNNKEIDYFLTNRINCTKNKYCANDFSLIGAKQIINNHFENSQVNLTDLYMSMPATMSLGILLSYLYDTQKTALSHLVNLNLYSNSQFMELDISTRKNLELTSTMRSSEKKGSLLGVLDKTKSSMGARLMRTYIEQPLININAINTRLSIVNSFFKNYDICTEIREQLKNVYDIERLMTRIVYSTANARDLKMLYNTLCVVPKMKELLFALNDKSVKDLNEMLVELKDISLIIDTAIVDDPPFSVREGGMIKTGYNAELDELKKIRDNSNDWLSDYLEKERQSTGIKNLKIGYNKVFGYFIEVTNSYKDLVPVNYIRKQTLVNNERYITETLKQMEDKILGANEKIYRIEYEIFTEIRNQITNSLHSIQKIALALSQIDVFSSFAYVAKLNDYTMPEIDCSDTIEIKDGRHPVVESLQKDTMFIANDTCLDCKRSRMHLITGPNMAGKSTYMRQVAVITLMAQIGCFVPAKSAKIGIVDKIFTRVGASDDLAAGQSTFMVEMSEVAYILKNATSKSLLIFDEVGRGTSTYDGMSVAQAVIEYVSDAKNICAKTLFATHYHELTQLEGKIDGLINYNVAVKKHGDEIVFLRKIIKGATDDSYGIEVAKLAGVPNQVINRAKKILKDIEDGLYFNDTGNCRETSETVDEQPQMSLMDTYANQIVNELKNISVDVLTPIEAMTKLYELSKKAKEL